ncbi:hypothetical protein SCARD494_08328 [Seiridium cardinale]
MGVGLITARLGREFGIRRSREWEWEACRCKPSIAPPPQAQAPLPMLMPLPPQQPQPQAVPLPVQRQPAMIGWHEESESAEAKRKRREKKQKRRRERGEREVSDVWTINEGSELEGKVRAGAERRMKGIECGKCMILILERGGMAVDFVVFGFRLWFGAGCNVD